MGAGIKATVALEGENPQRVFPHVRGPASLMTGLTP